jgi:hypothetical protein
MIELDGALPEVGLKRLRDSRAYAKQLIDESLDEQ